MRLIIHIGTHKTGTTSIQKFCARHRTELRETGLWYPDYDVVGGGLHYAHHHLANIVAGLQTSRGGPEDGGRIFGAIRENARADETVLISAETFWRHVYPGFGQGVNEIEVTGSEEAYWDRRRDFVARLFGLTGQDAEIAVVFRRQDDLAESSFKQRVKGTAYTQTFETFVEAFGHRFRYFDHLSVWKEYFPKLRVLVYEDLCRSSDLIGAFLGTLGLRVAPELDRSTAHNVGLSNDLIAFKHHLNRSGLTEEDLYDLSLVLEDDRFCDGLTLDSGSTLWRTREDRLAFLALFREQNDRVLREFTQLRRDSLFPEPGPERKPAYRGLAPDLQKRIESRIAEMGA